MLEEYGTSPPMAVEAWFGLKLGWKKHTIASFPMTDVQFHAPFMTRQGRYDVLTSLVRK